MQTRAIPPITAISSAGFVVTLTLIPELSHAAALGSPEIRLAYIDPGSGSFILQALIAAVAGVAVAVNAYWGKIKGILGIGSSKSEDESADRESNDG